MDNIINFPARIADGKLQLAYSIPNAAQAVDLSVTKIREEIAANRLIPSYAGTKPIIPLEELVRWLRSLPQEKAA